MSDDLDAARRSAQSWCGNCAGRLINGRWKVRVWRCSTTWVWVVPVW